MDNITNATETFVALNQSILDDYSAKNYPNVVANGGGTTLKIQVAKKYIKVWAWRYDRKESIHAFINMENGDVLMPAGLNTPAKHARGSVFADDKGASALTQNGSIRYL